MSRDLTTRAARKMAEARKTNGGPPRKPAFCPRCGAQRPTTRGALKHCAGVIAG
jgi:hypothetical protein